jgi:hypothetical protein
VPFSLLQIATRSMCLYVIRVIDLLREKTLLFSFDFPKAWKNSHFRFFLFLQLCDDLQTDVNLKAPLEWKRSELALSSKPNTPPCSRRFLANPEVSGRRAVRASVA